MSTERFTATLKFMHPTRGYGFLVTARGENHFVHQRDLEASNINCELLRDGASRLSYVLQQDERNQKLKAVDLRIEE